MDDNSTLTINKSSETSDKSNNRIKCYLDRGKIYFRKESEEMINKNYTSNRKKALKRDTLRELINTVEQFESSGELSHSMAKAIKQWALSIYFEDLVLPYLDPFISRMDKYWTKVTNELVSLND